MVRETIAGVEMVDLAKAGVVDSLEAIVGENCRICRKVLKPREGMRLDFTYRANGQPAFLGSQGKPVYLCYGCILGPIASTLLSDSRKPAAEEVSSRRIQNRQRVRP